MRQRYDEWRIRKRRLRVPRRLWRHRILSFDYNPSGGQDLLDVTALNISAVNFNSLVDIDRVGNSTLITIGDDTITLVGVKNGVDFHDFILV
jgi:hypothetical protein